MCFLSNYQVFLTGSLPTVEWQEPTLEEKARAWCGLTSTVDLVTSNLYDYQMGDVYNARPALWPVTI